MKCHELSTFLNWTCHRHSGYSFCSGHFLGYWQSSHIYLRDHTQSSLRVSCCPYVRAPFNACAPAASPPLVWTLISSVPCHYCKSYMPWARPSTHAPSHPQPQPLPPCSFTSKSFRTPHPRKTMQWSHSQPFPKSQVAGTFPPRSSVSKPSSRYTPHFLTYSAPVIFAGELEETCGLWVPSSCCQIPQIFGLPSPWDG